MLRRLRHARCLHVAYRALARHVRTETSHAYRDSPLDASRISTASSKKVSREQSPKNKDAPHGETLTGVFPEGNLVFDAVDVKNRKQAAQIQPDSVEEQREEPVVAARGKAKRMSTASSTRRKRKKENLSPSTSETTEVLEACPSTETGMEAAAEERQGAPSERITAGLEADRSPSAWASLFYHSGMPTDLTRAAASAAALAVSPLRINGSPVQHYHDRVRDFVINPFNGRETSVHSPTMHQLEGLGFGRDPGNPLHLTWSPETYFQRFHKTLRHVQQRRLRSVEQRPNKTASRAAESVTGEVTTEDVLSVMLRSFERGPKTPLWRTAVSQLLRRRDALTAVPAELKARYDSLTSAYMPPKLDATPDPASSGLALTPDQENVAQLAMRGYSLFVGGSAGTGKTVLIKVVYRRLTQLGLRVAMTASTGVAAVQLGGCTFHRAFNVPVEENGFTVRKPWDYNALRAVDVLILDEVSLLSSQMIDALDMEARFARMHYSPFGGIQVIFCGDFMQLATETTVDARPAYQSEAFKHLLRLKLVTPMRHRRGDPLVPLLNELRRGRCNMEVMRALDRPVPADAREVTYIYPRRRDAQQLNDAKLAELMTEEMVCAPQRGPLELVGDFTHSAFLLFDARPDDAWVGLPQRETIVQTVREEVAAVLSEVANGIEGVETLSPTATDAADTSTADRTGTSPSGEPVVMSRSSQGFKTLADHDIVVMPTRTTAPGVLLRLRAYVDPVEVAMRREALREARLQKRTKPAPHSSAASAASAATAQRIAKSSPFPFLQPEESVAEATRQAEGQAAGEASTGDPATASLPPRFLRSPAAYLVSHPQLWAAAVARVAARLPATVVNIFEQEPSELVPLSVSNAIADPHEGEATDSLQPLRLKVGARVMVNRNLSHTVSNGSVGVVEAFAPPDYKLFPQQVEVSTRSYYQRALGRRLFDFLPVVRLLSGEVVQIPPLPTMLGGTVVTYYYGHEVYTLPLQLGYGFTVHKVQGLTLNGLVVLDCQNFFECPHLIYVACSRVRSLDQLIVRNLTPDMVIVKKSALDFSNSLQEAKEGVVLAVPPGTPRATWATRYAPPVHAL